MYKSGQGVFLATADRNDIDTRTSVKHHPSSEFIGPSNTSQAFNEEPCIVFALLL
jgi:hypothetical protein